MKDRIRQIMESLHMTQQVFADYIGQSPATLSSIFNGRTRPTLNIIEAIKKKIPNINTDWLMFGSGDMYRADADPGSSSSTPADSVQDGQMTNQNPMLDFDGSQPQVPQMEFQTAPNYNSVKSTRSEIIREEMKIPDKKPRRVIEIRVFYDDQTWDTFVPSSSISR